MLTPIYTTPTFTLHHHLAPEAATEYATEVKTFQIGHDAFDAQRGHLDACRSDFVSTPPCSARWA